MEIWVRWSPIRSDRGHRSPSLQSSSLLGPESKTPQPPPPRASFDLHELLTHFFGIFSLSLPKADSFAKNKEEDYEFSLSV